MFILRILICIGWTVFASTHCWPAHDRALFWELTQQPSSNKNLTVHILGSLHLANEDIYPLRESINQAFIHSETLIVELDITQFQREIKQFIHQRGHYTLPDTLRNHISSNHFTKLINYLQQESLPVDTFIQQRPALLAITLSQYQLQKAGLNPDLGLDRHFIQHAQQLDKTIRSLENVEDQLAALFVIPDDEVLIEQALNQAEDLPELANRMLSAWKTGNSEKLRQLIVKSNDFNKILEQKPILDALLYKRNHKMAERLNSWFKEGGHYFIVVGSGHLVGEQNLLKLLKDRGYHFKQL